MKYIINGIEFDTEQRTLSYQNQTVLLEAKSFELLREFVNHPQQVLSRDKLIQRVWQGHVVSDGAVNKAISKLRQHFEQLQPNIEFIVTKPKFGYQLNFTAQLYEQSTAQCTHTKSLPIKKVFIICALLSAFSLAIYIFFTAQKKPNQNYTVNIERISAHDGLETNLSTSNNGQLLFLSSPTTNTPRQLILKSLDNNSEQNIPLDIQRLRFASLSPSGAFILWVSKDAQRCDIFRYDIASKIQQSVFNCDGMQNIRLSWQANEQAAFIRARENNASPYIIYQLSLTTKVLQQLSLPLQYAQMKGDFLLAAHPSKNQLAYVRYIESNLSDIHIIDTQNLDTLSVHSVDFMIDALNWSVTDDALYIADKKSLKRLDTNTGQTTNIKQFSYPIESIAVSTKAAQERILVSQYHASSSINQHQIATGKSVSIFSNAALNRLPRNYQEGMLFISDMGKEHALWRFEHEQLTRLNIPFEFGFARYDITHSGESLIFEKLGAVYEYNIVNKQLNKLINSNHQTYAVNYGNNNKEILYSSNKTGQWQLWLYNRNTKIHQQLTQLGGYSGYFHQGQLYFSKRHQSGLYALTKDKELLVIKDFSNINWLNWQLINGNIYFYRRGAGIWRYNISTKIEQQIMPEHARFIHQYHVSADEQTIIYVQLQPMQGDIQAITLR
ncbi:hypothetical protein PSECIP111854_01397 [Pseudoalteromonas sp. CIP111854]|uniref:OmpR/PhoB-type domain-containing protein n=1 Tax=Pseudoalteromonas holothuriae TaxID=2963714 RepID=A0A9W4QVA6_9GAMM|nr:winged helix-turn-helix domain-containing protein [Pseudoalteromonas sp. CIP111854]CAH9054551.1 hypothetical protein PSECIP111854_01397 [Pseudoalteromonas sp. CIP111854]